MIRLAFYALSLLLWLLSSSCHTPQPIRPMEYYDAPGALPTSVLQLPVHLDRQMLESLVNAQLNGIIYEDTRFDDGDNLKVKAEKRDFISLEVGADQFQYRVPLKLNIEYNAGITTLRARGDLALTFVTKFAIQPDWKLSTTTEVGAYEWLEKPKLRLAGLDIPIRPIADAAMQQSKAVITQSIDKIVSDQFNLRKYIEDAWRQMFEPTLLSEEYRSWLLLNPLSLSMTPLASDRDTIKSNIVVMALPQISIGEKPQRPEATLLPNFTPSTKATDNFTFYMRVDIPYREAETLAKAQLVGQNFQSGKYAVTLKGLELYGRGDNLIINTTLAGSYNGQIYFSGKPRYDAAKKSLAIKELDYTLETRNFLFKSGGWLFKSNIKKMIQDNIDEMFGYQLNSLREQIAGELSHYEPAKGILVNGQLKQLDIIDAYLTPNGIRLHVDLQGKVLVNVKGLTEMGKTR